MKKHRAGETVDYTITYLEMTARPSYVRPHLFGKDPSALVHSIKPPVWYFLALYDAVGRAYAWDDAHAETPEDIRAFVEDDNVATYTFIRNGWPHGFFMLDTRALPVCNISYFGLVPEAIGQGLGTWLLQTAVHMAWDIHGVDKVTLNTCTLDHPRALANYQRNGFEPVRQETKSRILNRDWDPATFP